MNKKMFYSHKKYIVISLENIHIKVRHNKRKHVYTFVNKIYMVKT